MATDARQRAARLKHSMEQQRSGESESKTTGSASGSVLRLSLSGDSDVTSAPRALGERDINTEKPVALANAGPKRKTTHLPAAHGPF